MPVQQLYDCEEFMVLDPFSTPRNVLNPLMILEKPILQEREEWLDPSST